MLHQVRRRLPALLALAVMTILAAGCSARPASPATPATPASPTLTTPAPADPVLDSTQSSTPSEPRDPVPAGKSPTANPTPPQPADASHTPAQSPGSTEPVAVNGTLEQVPASEVEQVVQTALSRPFTVVWDDQREWQNAASRYHQFGISRNGDQYFLFPNGHGYLHRGVRSWEVEMTARTDCSLGDKCEDGVSWNGPYAAGIPQKPGFAVIERTTPAQWGILDLLKAVPALFRPTPGNGGELIWSWQGEPGISLLLHNEHEQVVVTGLWVTLRQVEGTLLPVRYTIEGRSKSVAPTGGVLEVGEYIWAEPIFPVLPTAADPPEQQLGYAYIWLGEHRDDTFFVFKPDTITPQSDGTTLESRKSLELLYDADGYVIRIRITNGWLLNRLQIGDSRDEALRRLGPPTEEAPGVLMYAYPLGRWLEVLLDGDGRISEFRMILSPGQPRIPRGW